MGKVTIGYAALQYKVAGFGGLRKGYRDISVMLVQGIFFARTEASAYPVIFLEIV
jgi:hypothetical protein